MKFEIKKFLVLSHLFHSGWIAGPKIRLHLNEKGLPIRPTTFSLLINGLVDAGFLQEDTKQGGERRRGIPQKVYKLNKTGEKKLREWTELIQPSLEQAQLGFASTVQGKQNYKKRKR